MPLFLNLHAVLAVSRNPTGFRGINGAFPRGHCPFHLFRDPVEFRLTAARAVIGARVGKPAGWLRTTTTRLASEEDERWGRACAEFHNNHAELFYPGGGDAQSGAVSFVSTPPPIPVNFIDTVLSGSGRVARIVTQLSFGAEPRRSVADCIRGSDGSRRS